MAMRTARRFFQTGGFGGGDADAPAVTFTATTTTSPQTLTLQSVGVAAGETVFADMGDGSPLKEWTGTALRSHEYATAGEYTVRILSPQHLRRFDVRDNKITLDSVNLRVASGLNILALNNLRAGTVINSVDFVDIPLVDFRLWGMPAGNYTINTADFVGKALTFLDLSSMPAGNYTINTADFAGMSFTTFALAALPAGTYTINTADFVAAPLSIWLVFNLPPASTAWTINANDLAGLTALSLYRMDGNGFNQTQVDEILYGLHQAAVVPRTASNGTINVGGTNAAPSGTLEQPANCEDTGTWSGKNFAYELANDGCEKGFNTWATVTITT